MITCLEPHRCLQQAIQEKKKGAVFRNVKRLTKSSSHPLSLHTMALGAIESLTNGLPSKTTVSSRGVQTVRFVPFQPNQKKSA